MAMLKQYKHYIIALILLLCIKFFVPAANGLTDVGVNVLAVLVPILYLWLTVGTDWVSLLALAGVIISGVLSATDTYAASMGSSTIIIVITCMGLNKVLSDTGVIKKIAHWFLTRNLVRNRPYAFMAMFFLAATLLGLILECATLAIIFITLATEICDEIGYKKGDPFYTALIIGIFWVSNITNAATPICHAVPLIMVGTAAASGITISYTQWMTLGLPFAFLMYLLLLFVICVLWKPEASKYKNYDLDAARAKKIPLNKQGIISVVIFVLVVLAWIVPEVFPNLLPAAATAALKAWGNTVPAIIAVCLLCVIHVDGKPISKFSELASAAPMSLLIFIGAVVVLGSAVSSADTGISLALNNLLAPMTETLSPTILVGIGVLLCLIMTNFVSNVVSMLLFFGLVIPVATGTSISLVGVSIIICLVANFASLVPSAAVTAPLFFGPQHITVKNTVKWNLIMILFAFLVCMLVLFPLGNAVL